MKITLLFFSITLTYCATENYFSFHFHFFVYSYDYVLCCWYIFTFYVNGTHFSDLVLFIRLFCCIWFFWITSTIFMRLTIFKAFPYPNCHRWAYSQVFLHSLVTIIVKTHGWENGWSGKSCSGEGADVQSGQGSLRRGSASLESVHEKVPIGELCRYRFVCETSLKEIF